MSEHHPIDLNGLLDRIGGDLDLALEIFEIFSDSAPGLLAQLDGALRARQKDRCVALAHELKGTAANIGAPELKRQANLLELSLGRGYFDHAAEHFRLLQGELVRVLAAIDTLQPIHNNQQSDGGTP